jgi:hypothetical protein
MQSKQVQQLLPVVEKMGLNEQQMLIGIIHKFSSKAKVILLACIVKVDSLVDIQFLFPHQFLMDHFVITMV